MITVWAEPKIRHLRHMSLYAIPDSSEPGKAGWGGPHAASACTRSTRTP